MMGSKREIGILSLLWLAILPVWGGTGRPGDGFLSFVLLFGFLLILFGILHGIECLKRWISELHKDIF